MFHERLAERLDQDDPLKAHRAAFHFPNRTSIHGTAAPGNGGDDKFLYFVGNSLGLQHSGVEAALMQELHKWRDQACEGHFEQPNPWFEVDDVLRADMASLVGARPSEVIIMNTLTVNLHLLLVAFYRPDGKRRKILCEKFPFPSDTHAFISQLRFHGLTEADLLDVSASDDAATAGNDQRNCVEIPTERFLDAIEKHHEEIAVIVIGGVHFLTGQFFDIQRIAAAAHKHGILIGVDAAHAAGNIALQLHDWNVDFACWCTYKYLNGGPGNIAAAYVHEKHHPKTDAPVTADGTPLHGQLKGWWGHRRTNRFSLHKEFDSAAGAACLQLSNPSVVSMMSLAPSVQLMAKVGITNLRKKSLLLTAFLEALLLERLPGKFTLVTPKDVERRGCQLSLRIHANSIPASAGASHEAYENGTNLDNDADRLQRLLRDQGVMVDCRPPDILRIAPVPLYNSFTDVYRLVNILHDIFVPKSA